MNRDFEDLGGRDPYEVLGVRPDASAEEINRRYRRLLRTTHPDVGGDHDAQATLNLARDILLDPIRRRDYEQRLRRPEPVEVVEVPDDGAPAYTDPFDWTYGPGPPAAATAPPYRPAFFPPPAPGHFPPPPGHFPPPPPGHFPPPPPVGRRFNRLAIVAVALSFCSPAGLILGIVALAQIRRRREDGAVLAAVAIAISAVFLLCGLATLAINLTEFSHTPTPVVGVPSPTGS